MLPQSASLKPLRDVQALLVHTGGAGLTAAAVKRAGTDDPARIGSYAIDWYRQSGQAFYGHVLICPAGEVYELAPLDRAAQHAAALDVRYMDHRWRYWARPLGEAWETHDRPPERVFDWWDRRWVGVSSPAAFVGRWPNNHTLALDLLPPPGADGHYAPVQVAAARAWLEDRCRVHGLPFDRRHVLGHEDVDPCRRGVVRKKYLDAQGRARSGVFGVPWDPGQSFWTALALEG